MTTLIKGPKSLPLSKDAPGSIGTYKNATKHPFHDMKIHVNDDSWDTPEFKRIKITKNGSHVSSTGGDLSEDEHLRFHPNVINPGEEFEIDAEFNDNVGDKAHLYIVPTAAGGKDITGDDSGTHEDITIWDKLMEWLEVIISLVKAAQKLVALADAKPFARDVLALASARVLTVALREAPVDDKTSRDLIEIDKDLRKTADQLIAFTEKLFAEVAYERKSEATSSGSRQRKKAGKGRAAKVGGKEKK